MLGGNLIIISFQTQLRATGVIPETHCVSTPVVTQPRVMQERHGTV